MKRIFSFALALFIALAFVACDQGKKPDDTKKPADDPKEGEEEQPQPIDIEDIVDRDAKLGIPAGTKYDYVCTVFVPEPHGRNRITVEAQNGAPVNDAIYNRNLKIQDELGVTFREISFDYTASNQSEKFIEEVLSGSHSFDFATVHSMYACAPLIMAGVVMPFSQLEYVDFSKPWWDKGLSETCSVMGDNYFALSPLCWNYYYNAGCILFNKDLAAENDLPDLYALVKNDEWTIDKLIDLTKNFSRDLDSNGIFDENDQLAIISDDSAYLNFWLGAFRQSTVEKGENDVPTIVAGTPRMENCVAKVNQLFHTGRRGLIYPMSERTDGDDEWRRAFVEGRVLFDVTIVSNATGMRGSDINFGILPLPKLNSDQERYGSWDDPWGQVVCVPSDNPDPERTGIILETLSYYSYQMIYPAVIQQSVYGTGTRDIESIEMLKIIYDNMFFDFGFFYDSAGTGYGDIFRTLVPNNSSDISSYLAEKRNTVTNHFEKLYDAMLDNYS